LTIWSKIDQKSTIFACFDSKTPFLKSLKGQFLEISF
jgi:hypothetical protein